jgi:hypothetical protein
MSKIEQVLPSMSSILPLQPLTITTMSSFTSSTDELSLAMLNAMVNGSSSAATFVTALDAVRNRTDEINICGLPCTGDCRTCVQSNADLNAFYGTAITVAPEVAAEPIEVVVMAPAGDEDDDWEEVARNARALDEAESAARNGMWADQNYDAADRADPADDDDYRGCQCLDCLNHDDQDYIPSYDDRDDGYDDGYGLDWNESGYFD